jgi:hypothetical protein
MRGRCPADTPTPALPRRDHARAPHTALDVATATVGTQRGQRATDHPRNRHFAASTVTTQRTNSLQQKLARPTVHRRPTMPVRHHLAAQRIQSMHAVPVCLDHVYPCSSCTPARHGDAITTPPLPSPVVHRNDPTTHRIARNVSEPGRLVTEPASHRHRHPYLCTQTTMPSRSTALAVQSCLMQTTLDRAHYF